jgi:hypothetical protein
LTTGTVVTPGTVTDAVMVAVPDVVVGRNFVTNCPPAGVVPEVSWRLQGELTPSAIVAFPMAQFEPSVTMIVMLAESVLSAVIHRLELVTATFTGSRAAALATMRRMPMNRIKRRLVVFPPGIIELYCIYTIYRYP